jgi:hypothetical protein
MAYVYIITNIINGKKYSLYLKKKKDIMKYTQNRKDFKMNVLQFVEYKIKDLEIRKKNVIVGSSAWAMQMSIDELKQVRNFIKDQEKFVKDKSMGVIQEDSEGAKHD